MRRVVVTGVGIISPLGIGSKAHWQALIAGEVSVKRIASLNPSGFACQIGGEAPPSKSATSFPEAIARPPR